MEDNPILPQSKTPRRARRRNLTNQGSAGEGLDEDELDGEQGTSGGYDGIPEVGMVFRTHQEATRFYKRYARRVGFGVSVRRSSFTKEGHCLYLELICCKGGRKRPEPKFRKRPTSTTNCQARIRVKLWGDGLLHLELATLDHNHPVSPSMARFLSCYKHLGAARRRPATSPSSAPLPDAPDPSLRVATDRFHGLEDLLFSESLQRSFVERGRLRLGDGDAGALRLFFTKMQAKNPSFFNVIDLDDEGRLRNVFWADARSRAAYQYFSDVVSLDTTYVINKYDLPLATFVGVNHHGQSVLLGCALISDEMTETYVWLLKAWLACMSGQVPKAMITDQCKGLQSAVTEVFRGIRHRLCLFQIMKKVPEKLGGLTEYRAIHKQLQKSVYDSLRIEEFEEEWRQMIEVFGLQGNEWLRSLYECRFLWVPTYLKDAFWAGMSTTQRNETLSAFFDGYVDAKTSLKQFIGKYEMTLQSKYEKEAQADFETFHKRRPSVSKFIMEEQLSKIYTIKTFKKFQDEIEAIMYCHASLVNTEGSISTFDVKECIFLEDGKKTMNKNYGVIFNTEEKDVQCICGSFQFRGILCRHALSVFKLQQVHEIPPQFILDRWKKDLKRLHIMARSSNDVVANNRVDRYDYLSKRCLELVEIGVLSDKYELALKLIKEAEKFLLNDSTYEDTQPKIVSRVPKTNKPDRISNQNGGKTMTSEKTSNKNDEPQSNHPQQGKESQVPPGMSKVGNQGYAFQVVPTILHLHAHQEGLNPPPLPFPGHFGPVMSHQHYIGNQAGPRPGIVYMFPGGVDPQAFGNGPMMPWIYQQMFQATQQPIAPLDPRAGQAPKRRKVRRSSKPGRAARNPEALPVTTAAPTADPAAPAPTVGPSAELKVVAS